MVVPAVAESMFFRSKQHVRVGWSSTFSVVKCQIFVGNQALPKLSVPGTLEVVWGSQ